MVLKHILLPNVAFWSLKKQAPNAAAKFSKSEALREPNTKAPGVCFSSDAPPADGWGLRIGVFSRKFRESSAKSKCILKGVAQLALQKIAWSATTCPEKGIPLC